MRQISQSAPVSGTARDPIARQHAPMAHAKIISLIDHEVRALDRAWTEEQSAARGWMTTQLADMTLMLRRDINALHAIVRRLCDEVDKLELDLAALKQGGVPLR